MEWKSVKGFEGVQASTLCYKNCCMNIFAIDLIRCFLIAEWFSIRKHRCWSRPLLPYDHLPNGMKRDASLGLQCICNQCLSILKLMHGLHDMNQHIVIWSWIIKNWFHNKKIQSEHNLVDNTQTMMDCPTLLCGELTKHVLYWITWIHAYWIPWLALTNWVMCISICICKESANSLSRAKMA